MDIQLKISGDTQKRIDQAVKTIPEHIKMAVRNATSYLEVKIVENTPIGKSRTKGGLHGSWHDKVSGFQGMIYTDKHYAIYVHEGTRPHIIRPKNGRALMWPGAPHPYRMVHHPGTKANPFVTRTLDQQRKAIEEYFIRAMDQSIQ